MSNDVSLEDELLQVTEKKSTKKSQKKSKKDKSPKRDEDEEEEGALSGSNDDDSDHKTNGKRKPKSESKKPLKKRKTDSSSEGDSSDDEVYDDGWDDKLYGDSADRAWLESLPEIEREAILDERYERRKEMRAEFEVKRRLKAEQRSKRDADKKESKKESRRETRETKDREKRDRGAKKSESKGKALSELKKRRAKAGYKKSDSDFDEAEEGEVEEEKDDDYSPKKGASPDREISSKSSKGSSHKQMKDDDDDYDDADEDTATSSRDKGRESAKEPQRDGRPVSFEELDQLRLSRETLEKWMDKPFFDGLIPGFFVRIGIGMDPTSRLNVYRVAQIQTVEVKSSYPLAGKQTTKWLRLLIGDKAKEFKMETVSNRPFTESEFTHWKMQMERCKRELPYSADVPAKIETLATAKNYSYTSSDIEKMLAEKKQAGVLPVKLAGEKARLILLRDATADAEEKARLSDQINRIDELIKEKAAKPKKQSSVLNINQRNREANFIATLEAKIEERSANSDLDPFSRRRTLPSITYSSKKKENEPQPENGNNNNTPSAPSTSTPTATPSSTSTPADRKSVV